MADVPVSPSYVLAQLRGVDILRGLDEDVLARLAERVVVQDHEPGTVVLAQGADASGGMHLIFDGTATVERNEVVIGLIGPGEHVGEIALLDGQPRVATIRAESRLRTGLLTSSDFLDVVEDNPDVALAVLAALATRFRFLEERLSRIESRLAEYEGLEPEQD